MTAEGKIFGTPVLPVQRGGNGAQDDLNSGFDFTALLQMVRVRHRIIIGTAALVVAIATVYVFSKTPLYDASAVVILDQRENRVTDVNAVLSGLRTDYVSVQNQIEILHSRGLMARVVKKLHLDEAPPPAAKSRDFIATVVHDAFYYANPRHWFGESKAPSTKQQADDRQEALINELLGGEKVEPVGDSAAMKITFRSPDPAHSALVANAIADAYVEDQLDAKFEATQKTSKWLADRLQQLSSQMQAADAAVQQYKATHNITEVGDGQSILDQQLAQLNGQLVTARSDLAEAQAKYSRVKALQASGRAEDVAQVFQSGMISQLRQQQADLLQQKAQLSTVYGPRHPKMLDIESQLRNINTKINQEVKRVVETVANDVTVARAHVQSLEDSLQQLEGQTTSQNKAKVKLIALNAAASSAHQLYEAFLGKFKETQGQEGIQTPDARIISRAIVPSAPASPNKRRTIELALVGGLFLGFALAWLAERLDSGFRTSAQLERALGIPVLSILPELQSVTKDEDQAANRVIDKPLSSFSEAVRGLQMGLALSNVDRKPKVVLVTSSVPGEGKTTVALSLARISARAGQKVLLIDCDLRRPNVAKAAGVSNKENGLIDVLLGSAKLEDRLIRDKLSDVKILPTAHIASNPPDLLGSETMENLVNGLKNHFDMVIIDSAPLLPVNDTKMLARLAEAVVFVVRWEKTPREAVNNAARALIDLSAPVAGAVLSRADNERYRYYSYGYQSYYSYQKYYSD